MRADSIVCGHLSLKAKTELSNATFFFVVAPKYFDVEKLFKQRFLFLYFIHFFFFFFAYFVVVVEQESVAWPRRRRPFGRRAFP